MPYISDGASNNGNGKPGFIGEVATEYAAARLGAISPMVAAAMRVIRARQASAAPRPTVITATRRVIPTIIRRTNTVPVVNVTSLPNGTAVPTPTNGSTPPAGPPYYPAVTGGPGYGAPAQSGGGFGPPADFPDVEVGTIDDGGDSNISTAGMSNALAGLTSSKPLLAGIALLAFFMLDGKPKRRRR